MGTIKAGFWHGRFLISTDEFSNWVDLCKSEEFYFKGNTLESPLLNYEEVKTRYNDFYAKRMDSVNYYTQIGVPYATLFKDGFDHAINLGGNRWRFWWKDKTTSLDDTFIIISSCKHYSVTSDCGKYFTYENILQKEPLAKEYFDKLTKPLKNITKPLYQNGKPMYSVRISEQAYIDLLDSAFNKNMHEPLTSKWDK